MVSHAEVCMLTETLIAGKPLFQLFEYQQEMLQRFHSMAFVQRYSEAIPVDYVLPFRVIR